jgi:NAD(P)-dependent dehydrogenase (short-subunit alcohol dehydrogenase family)
MSLTGKVGIITGAGRGIGRALALAMARAGATLVLNDAGLSVDGSPDDDRPVERVAAEIAAHGGTAVVDCESVVSFDAMQQLAARAVREFGRLDFVVNNAGILRDAIFHKMAEPEWDAVIAVHLKGTFNLSRAAAGIFRRQQSGAIVNMTSTSGLIGNYGQANYAAAKLGIVALTRAIALDLRRYNVRANAVAPFAATRMTATIPDATAVDRQRHDRLRELAPTLIAPLAVHLVSDASARISGQVFAVRGSEISLFSLPRPIATIYRPGGWDAASLDEHLRSLSAQFVPLEVTADVFPADPKL